MSLSDFKTLNENGINISSGGKTRGIRSAKFSNPQNPAIISKQTLNDLPTEAQIEFEGYINDKNFATGTEFYVPIVRSDLEKAYVLVMIFNRDANLYVYDGNFTSDYPNAPARAGSGKYNPQGDAWNKYRISVYIDAGQLNVVVEIEKSGEFKIQSAFADGQIDLTSGFGLGVGGAGPSDGDSASVDNIIIRY
jgi:hypothetical protein